MLLYFFFALGAWKGALGKDINCDEPEYRVCRLDANISFPSSEADIDRMCPHTCHMDAAENYCCHERGIVENIGCFDEVVREDNEACDDYLRGKIKPMREHIQNLEAKRGEDKAIYDSELWLPYQCLLHSFEFSCLVSKSSERCGSEAADLALEVFSRSGITRRSCAPSSKEKLALLELELGEESAMNRLISKE